ncbi:MAG: single-stranded DNA-binding protein [Lachnospiraceae bacterium]|nr:single-stranded DNA-binding protein [Lachnospiraceae bacterium]
MNKVILMGRLTAEPEMKYSSKDSSMAITRYTLAVDRRFARKEDGATTADFIRCVAFGKAGEFASKYFHKGQRVLVEGRLQIGSFTNKDGQKVPTADVVIENQEFADAPKAGQVVPTASKESSASVMDGFMDVDGSTDDDEVPF